MSFVGTIIGIDFVMWEQPRVIVLNTINNTFQTYALFDVNLQQLKNYIEERMDYFHSQIARNIMELTRFIHVNELILQHERLLVEAQLWRFMTPPEPTYTINTRIQEWLENINNSDWLEEDIYSPDD